MSEHFQTIVVGAGVAGAAVADALNRAGHEVLVVGDTSDQVPGATLHAFPGWSFRRDASELSAFEIAAETLRAMPAEVAIAREMHRPLAGRSAARLRRSYADVAATLPAWITHRREEDRIVYGPAFGVDTRGLLATLLKDVEHREVELLPGWRRESSLLSLRTRDGEALLAERIVIATGAGLCDWLPTLPVEVFGGDIVEFEVWNLEHFVAAGGHVGPMPSGRPVAGASFWSLDAQPETSAAMESLITRLSAVVPEITDRPIHRFWTGYRAVADDRRPVCGEVAENVWVTGALGARGLYWSFGLARWLTEAIVRGGTIPADLDVRRFVG